MANSIISGSVGTRKVRPEKGYNAQIGGEALLQAKSRSPVLELKQLSKGVAWFMIYPVQSEFSNWKVMGWVYKGEVLLPAECSAPTESWPQIIIMEIETLNLIFVWTLFEIWHWLLWDKWGPEMLSVLFCRSADVTLESWMSPSSLVSSPVHLSEVTELCWGGLEIKRDLYTKASGHL